MSVSSILSRIAPQYDSTPDRNGFISDAESMTNRCWYGVNADRAVALMAAHMIALNTSLIRQNGETGAISSKKEGDLAIGFVAGAGQGINDLDQTHYGKQLKHLRAGGGAFLGVTGGNLRGC